MKPVAIGVRIHSGWGSLVGVSGQRNAIEIIDRQKVIVIDPKAAGAKQPYHYAKEIGLQAAEQHLAKCTAQSEGLAMEALKLIFARLGERGYAVTGSVIVLSSARPLPTLAGILASHALIHTAEGEFFRHTFRQVLQRLGVAVTGIRESELDDYAQKAFGKASGTIREKIDGMGRILGPPWTQDEKTASLAAAIILAKQETGVGQHSKVQSAGKRGA